MGTEAGPIGLITAIPQEMDHFRGHFSAQGMVDIAGWSFHSGTIDGTAVVAVEAGIGKVNAAMVASLLIDHFGVRALIFSGVAGGLAPHAQIGDAVVASTLIQHDYGAIVEDRLVRYQPGAFPLPGVPPAHGYFLPPDLAAALEQRLGRLPLPPFSARGGARPSLHFGIVLTGDQFLNCAVARDRLHGETGALAVEMEGAAIAQVAERFGVPWAVIRVVSDQAGVDSHAHFATFLAEAAESAAGLVRQALPVLVNAAKGAG